MFPPPDLSVPLSPVNPGPHSLQLDRTFGVLVLSDESEVLLHQGDNVVGTSASALVRLQDCTVDTEHAVLSFFDDSMPAGPSIEDLRSQYGTFLNSRRLQPYRAVPIENLDNLSFGNVTAVFYPLDHYLNVSL